MPKFVFFVAETPNATRVKEGGVVGRLKVPEKNLPQLIQQIQDAFAAYPPNTLRTACSKAHVCECIKDVGGENTFKHNCPTAILTANELIHAWNLLQSTKLSVAPRTRALRLR